VSTTKKKRRLTSARGRVRTLHAKRLSFAVRALKRYQPFLSLSLSLSLSPSVRLEPVRQRSVRDMRLCPVSSLWTVKKTDSKIFVCTGGDSCLFTFARDAEIRTLVANVSFGRRSITNFRQIFRSRFFR